MIHPKTPWCQHMGDVPMHLTYFEGSMFDALKNCAAKYPNHIALDFMGTSTSYRKLVQQIKTCAKALKAMGLQENDHVTIALPNCPQGVFLVYAVNLAGGIANMVHPLSAEKEIEFYLKETRSPIAITLDRFYSKFAQACENTGLKKIIVTGIADTLPAGLFCRLTAGATAPPAINWKQFIKLGKGYSQDCPVSRSAQDPAVILYSGGTTGTTKGIVLTNRNFNALAQQVLAANPMFCPGDKMLAAMPMFHGFGLGVCIHSMLFSGGRCVLVPRFTPKSYARDLVRKRCNFIAGVPTLFAALLQLEGMEGKDLRCLKGVFSGGDCLSAELKKNIDEFLRRHNAPVQVREGYGTTETVTACCLTPPHISKEGSIGLPFPDTYIKIVAPGTDRELPYGEEGEILLAGPTVMSQYLHNPQETAQTLRAHPDGLTWVYTGDLGVMDSDGFVYFRGRAKRMIVTSGYNVYPGQLEEVLNSHASVRMSCVVGVPDAYKMQKVIAFVKLKEGIDPTDHLKESILEHCRKYVAKYAIPCDIVFREHMPTTAVGKIAYRVLEQEASNQ